MKIKIEQEPSAWHNLSMRDRAKYIHNSVKNHFANGGFMTDISIDDIRHQFNDGGEKDIYAKANAILDERIKQKMMENRPSYEDWINRERSKVTQAAFEYSNQRTSPSYIMQDNPYKTEEEWTSAMDSIIAERQKELNDSIKLNMDQPPMIQQMNISVAQQKLDDAIWEKNQGYSLKIPANSCLTTATNNYVQVTGDKSYGANLNSYFQNNHPGYEVVPGFEDAVQGNIVQLLEDNGEAKHGMIYAGQNDQGQYIFNNSAGGSEDIAYKKGISFRSINNDKNPNDHVQILRFIGNDKWNEEKKEDYNLRYPAFMQQGGKLFDDEGNTKTSNKGNILGLEVPLWAETAASFIPFLGTAMDIKQAWQEPTFENISTAGLSTIGDLAGLSIIKGLSKLGRLHKAEKAVRELTKTAGKTEDYSRLLKAQEELKEAKKVFNGGYGPDVTDEISHGLGKYGLIGLDQYNNTRQNLEKYGININSYQKSNGGTLFAEGGPENEQTLADEKVNYSYFLHPIDAFRYNGSPSYNTDIPFATAFTDAIRNNQENFQWGDNIYNTDIDWKHHFSKDKKGNSPFKEFAEVMYPAVIKVLQEQGLPITNAHNIVRQAAIESNYGTDPRGAQGYNLSGIKWTKSADPKYKHTTGADGEEYIDFDNLKDYIYYKVKILNDNYDALNAKNAKDFARRLHPNAAGIPTNQRASGYKGDYSGDYNSYKNNITNLNSLDKTLFHQMYKPLFGK